MRSILKAVVIAIVLGGSAFAQVEPIVRVEITPETVALGEAVEMRVTVLVPTWFPRPPMYPSFELANAITRLPPDSSFPTSERIGRDTWSGIVRNYRLYPLLGASYRLDEQTIKVTYANPGADSVVIDVPIPPVEFRGAVPEGAEALNPYIAGRSLTLALNVDGPVEELAAGDALVLEYVAELDGLPAIFLPSLAPVLELDGVSVYANEPRVEDGPPARRREKLTLVFEAGGEFSVPDVALEYWNGESASIETVTASGFSFSVDGPPIGPAGALAPQGAQWWQLSAIVAMLIAALFLLWRNIPVLARKYRAAEERRSHTEVHAFNNMLRRLRAKDAGNAYHAMLTWISRLDPQTGIRQFARQFGDESLGREIDVLSSGIYRDRDNTANFQVLAKGLTAARRRCLEGLAGAERSALPSLNP